MTRPRAQPRDERGWRIPRAGTASAAIYKLARAGKSPIEISKEAMIEPNTVRVLLHRMQHPDLMNARERLYNATGLNPTEYAKLLLETGDSSHD